MLLRRRLQTTDYIPLWKSLAQPFAEEIPKEVLGTQRSSRTSRHAASRSRRPYSAPSATPSEAWPSLDRHRHHPFGDWPHSHRLVTAYGPSVANELEPANQRRFLLPSSWPEPI